MGGSGAQQVQHARRGRPATAPPHGVQLRVEPHQRVRALLPAEQHAERSIMERISAMDSTRDA
jgi:hypothetical protein